MSMRDEDIQTPPELSPAQAAVLYVLRRIRCDVDLRWLMLDTEAMHRLCLAEAARRGINVDQIKDFYREPEEHCKTDKPRIKTLQDKIDKMEAVNASTSVDAYVAEQRACSEDHNAVEAALDLCPACHGLPERSINRCPMCQALINILVPA